MCSSTTITTIPLTVLMLVMGNNVVVSNGQGKIEHPVEVAILWDNAVVYENYNFINLRAYRENILTRFNHSFSLGETKVRVAVIDFDSVGSTIRLNLTTALEPFKYKGDERWKTDPVALHKALQNAKDKIFIQSRLNALKVVFVILASKNGLNETADVEARKLRDQSVLICMVVFCKKDENISRLFDIANETDVYKHYWEDTPSKETAFTFAEKAVRWLKDRVSGIIPPSSVQPPQTGTETASSTVLGLYIGVSIMGAIILLFVGIAIGYFCGGICLGKKTGRMKEVDNSKMMGHGLHRGRSTDMHHHEAKGVHARAQFHGNRPIHNTRDRPEPVVAPGVLDKDKSTHKPQDRPESESHISFAFLDGNKLIPDAGHGPKPPQPPKPLDPRLGHPGVPEKTKESPRRR